MAIELVSDLEVEIECDCIVAWNNSPEGLINRDCVPEEFMIAFKAGYTAALKNLLPGE